MTPEDEQPAAAQAAVSSSKDQEARTKPASQPLDVRISFAELPPAILAAIENLGKPKQESTVKTFLKDYLPGITSLATAALAIVVAVYGALFSNEVLTENLNRITSDFIKTKGDPNVAAMRLAAYGDKALPAVRIVLGAQDQGLRLGGVLVLQQMYLEGTVRKGKLVSEMLENYDNPLLRRGVLQWLEQMKSNLPEGDRRLFFEKVKATLGAKAQNCDQDAAVAIEITNVLPIWSFAGSKELLEDMAQSCANPDVKKQATSMQGQIR